MEATSDRSFGRRLAWLVGAAAIVRLLYLWNVHEQGYLWNAVFLDAQVYRDWARQLVESGGRSPDAVFTLGPLYPWFLAVVDWLFGAGNLPVYLVQQALGLGTMVMTGWLGRRLAGDTAGLCAAAMMGFYASAANLELKFLATTLSVFLATLALVLLSNAHSSRRLAWSLGAGVALGLACLARPNLLLVAPFAAIWLMVERGTDGDGRLRSSGPHVLRAGMLTLGTVLAIAPATWHNWRVGGELIPISSQGGLTFYHANNPRAVGSYSDAEGFSGHPARLAHEARTMAQNGSGRALTTNEIDRYFYALGLRYLVEHPADGLVLLGRKALHWVGSAELGTEYVVSMERDLVPTLHLFCVPFGLILGFAVIGALRTRGRGADRSLLVGMVAINFATLMAFYVVSRYRLAAVPALSVLAGAGCAEVARSLGRAETRRRGARLALAAASITALSLVPTSAVELNHAAAERYNVAESVFVAGDYAAAAELYEEALERMDSRWQAHFNLGLARARLGEWGAAERSFRRVVELAPDNAIAALALAEARCKLAPGPECEESVADAPGHS